MDLASRKAAIKVQRSEVEENLLIKKKNGIKKMKNKKVRRPVLSSSSLFKGTLNAEPDSWYPKLMKMTK